MSNAQTLADQIKQAGISIGIHTAPYTDYLKTLKSFIKIHAHLSDAEYWTTLGDIWRDHNDTFHTSKLWRQLFLMPRAGNELFMHTADDRAFYANLPDQIKAYRGFGLYNREGFNYSLNLNVAMRFVAKHAPFGDYDIKILPKRDCLWVGTWAEHIIYVPGMGDVQDKVKTWFTKRV